MTDVELIKMAFKARENSYSPYSNYKVGAALLAKSGKVYLGANIENCAYGPSNCAERSAIFSALSNGEREFEKLAIVGTSDDICYPCGVCRQVIAELLPTADIICAKDENKYEVHKIGDLLPHAFSPKDVECARK
ncbi:MAG: cytidine deaminase [Clostridiales bacterium]|nr:cytidine deaminase [Clostridiales bacterium]